MAVADGRVHDLAAIASQLGQWREPLQLTPGADRWVPGAERRLHRAVVQLGRTVLLAVA